MWKGKIYYYFVQRKEYTHLSRIVAEITNSFQTII